MSGSLERKSLERQADRLGVPYVSSTTDDQLRMYISAKQQGDTMKVTEQDEKMYINGHEQPECFGLFYEGNVAGEDGEDCRECIFAAYCYKKFLAETLPETLEKLGPVTPGEIADHMGLSLSAIMQAMKDYKAVQAAEKKMAKAVEKAQAVAEPEPVPTIDEPPQEPEVEEPENPTQAESAKRAKASVKSVKKVVKLKTAKTAKTAEAPADTAQSRGWSSEHDAARWERERKRSKKIAALKAGSFLTREYRGQTYEVAILKQGYLYDGMEYPTLYAVTKEITGERVGPNGRKLANWSAAKFWKL